MLSNKLNDPSELKGKIMFPPYTNSLVAKHLPALWKKMKKMKDKYGFSLK